MVVELLNIVGGESAAQALSEIHARTECPTVSSDPVAPNLDHWQSKVLSYIAEKRGFSFRVGNWFGDPGQSH